MEDPYRYEDQGDRKHEITCYWPFSRQRKGQETKQQFASEMIGHDKSLHSARKICCLVSPTLTVIFMGLADCQGQRNGQAYG
jgi:hypothetical protein